MVTIHLELFVLFCLKGQCDNNTIEFCESCKVCPTDSSMYQNGTSGELQSCTQAAMVVTVHHSINVGYRGHRIKQFKSLVKIWQ